MSTWHLQVTQEDYRSGYRLWADYSPINGHRSSRYLSQKDPDFSRGILRSLVRNLNKKTVVTINNTDSGIVLVASPFDWLFAKGAIASCQYFMPDKPIQLIIDGAVETERAESSFKVKVLRKKDIDHPELRDLGFGWGTTKLLAFWYSHTKEFLYLDSDAVVWGNLAEKCRLYDSDYIASIIPKTVPKRADIENWFFDIKFIEDHFPDWDWRKSSTRFFCPGVFAARRNCFSLENYLDILRLNALHPGKFKFGDMGFHNMMVFRGADRGELKVTSRDFQVIFPEYNREALEHRFSFDAEGNPIVVPGDENVLHMPDHKPLVDSNMCYSRPMTYFRLQYLEKTEGVTGEEAMARLRAEDAEYHRLREEFLKQERTKKIRNLLKFHPGEWRRLLSKILKRER